MYIFRARGQLAQEVFEEGCEPIFIGIDQEPLFSVLSYVRFGQKRYWPLVKVGTLLHGATSKEDMRVGLSVDRNVKT